MSDASWMDPLIEAMQKAALDNKWTLIAPDGRVFIEPLPEIVRVVAAHALRDEGLKNEH